MLKIVFNVLSNNTMILRFTVIDKKKMTYGIDQKQKKNGFFVAVVVCKKCIINSKFYSYLEQYFIILLTIARTVARVIIYSFY